MRTSHLAAVGGAFLALPTFLILVGAQGPGSGIVTPETQGRALAPLTAEPAGGGGHSGCSGCYCCFPKTPDGFVGLQGFEEGPAYEVVLYQVPHHDWLMLTDLEAVAMDAAGLERRDVRLLLEAEDMMGVRTQVRWANCSVYHSARGLAIPPGSKLIMATEDRNNLPESFYWQLNGYLWPSAEH